MKRISAGCIADPQGIRLSFRMMKLVYFSDLWYHSPR